MGSGGERNAQRALQGDKPPWELPRMGVVGAAARIAAIFLLTLVFFVGPVIAIVGIWFLLKDWQTLSYLQRAVLFMGVAGAVAIMLVGRRGVHALWRRLNLSAYQKRAGAAPSFIISGHVLRLFESPGWIEFTPDRMVISGKMQPDEAGPVLFGLGLGLLWTLLCSTVFAAYAKGWILVALGWAIGIVGMRKSSAGAQDCTLSIGHGDVEDCRWRGPFAELILKSRSREGIKRFRFIVSREAAEWFFREFNRVFPDLLPRAYRMALD